MATSRSSVEALDLRQEITTAERYVECLQGHETIKNVPTAEKLKCQINSFSDDKGMSR